MPLPPRTVAPGIRLSAAAFENEEAIAGTDALSFVAFLERGFRQRRRELLEHRAALETSLRAGSPRLPPVSTAHVRADDEWRAAAPPAGWDSGDTQILCAPTPQSIQRALADGARRLLVDLEDSMATDWFSVMRSHQSLLEPASRECAMMVRTRGWRRAEAALLVDGEPCSAGLFDVALACFHQARADMPRGPDPVLCLPDICTHLEAQWWSDVLCLAQDELGLPRDRLRVAVEFTSPTALVEFDEILYELRDHAFAVACDDVRWLHNALRSWSDAPGRWIAPGADALRSGDAAREWRSRLAAGARRRGAIAIAGRFCHRPSTDDATVLEVSRRRTVAARSSAQSEGFDAICLTHTDAGEAPFVEAVRVVASHAPPAGGEVADLLPQWLATDPVALAAVDDAVSTCLLFLASRLAGRGCVEWANRVDRATEADFAAIQLWHWVHAGATGEDGATLDLDYVSRRAVAARDTLQRNHFADADAEAFFDAAMTLLLRQVGAAECPGATVTHMPG